MEERLRFTESNFEKLKELILNKGLKERTIFNFLNAYSIYLFHKHPNFRDRILGKKNINFIDGFPVSLILSFKNMKKVPRLRGPDFTNLFLSDKDLNSNKKHLFIGLDKERGGKILRKFPNLKKKNLIFYDIPFIKKYRYDYSELISLINKEKPDYIWIGIGNPKQEIFSNDLVEKITKGYLFNVGAAFDYIIGRKNRAPRFWQILGLEWFYRLITDFNHSYKKVLKSFLGCFYGFKHVELRKK